MHPRRGGGDAAMQCKQATAETWPSTSSTPHQPSKTTRWTPLLASTFIAKQTRWRTGTGLSRVIGRGRNQTNQSRRPTTRFSNKKGLRLGTKLNAHRQQKRSYEMLAARSGGFKRPDSPWHQLPPTTAGLAKHAQEHEQRKPTFASSPPSLQKENRKIEPLVQTQGKHTSQGPPRPCYMRAP